MLTKAKTLLLKRESAVAVGFCLQRERKREKKREREKREEPMLRRGNAGEATPSIA